MAEPHLVDQLRVFTANAIVLVNLLEEMGFSRHRIFHGTRIQESDLDDPRNIIAYSQYSHLISQAMDLVPGHTLPLEFGKRLSLTGQNRLSIGAIASENFTELLRFWVRAGKIVEPGFELKLKTGHHYTSVSFTELLPLEQVLKFKIDSFYSVLMSTANFLCPRIKSQVVCEFKFPPDQYRDDYKNFLGNRLIFNCAQNRIRFPVAFCDSTLAFHNPAAVRQAEQLLQELESLVMNSRLDLVMRVRKLMIASPESLPGLNELAGHFHISARTLKRSLHQAGTSYKAIANDIRRQIACEYLKRGDLSISEVSERLGYQDPSNFSHAFRRWVGQSPRVYTQALSGKTD